MTEELQNTSLSNQGEKQITADTTSLPPIPGKYRVMRRNGKVTSFDLDKIIVAMTKAFLSVEGSSAAASTRIHNEVELLASKVDTAIKRRFPEGGVIHIEDIQDQVELAIMRAGYQDVARSYVLYREERSQARNSNQIESLEDLPIKKSVINEDGSSQDLDIVKLRLIIDEACSGVEDVSADDVFELIDKNIYDGIKKEDLSSSILISIRPLIEKDPNYSYVVARLLLSSLYEEGLTFLNFKNNTPTIKEMSKLYPEYFKAYIKEAVDLELIDKELLNYDMEFIAKNIDPTKDLAFTYLGLQTLYDRYFIHEQGKRFELPQAFFMRVAMGLAINEENREERTIEFYNLISSFDFMCSTPTLFNSGTLRPQLSSCYLSTLPDDLKGILKALVMMRCYRSLQVDWAMIGHKSEH